MGSRVIILSFETRWLREVCRSEVYARRHLGEPAARILLRRIADIRAAPCILELPIGSPTVLGSTPPGKVQVDVTNDLFLVFSSAHKNTPFDANGAVEWGSVFRIKLLQLSGT